MGVTSNVFVEQAEYLDKQSFLSWGADHPDEKKILRKLMQGGAKLITGPRGCGKTTLILKAYNKLLPDDSALPVYVNFKRSLVIEPLYAASDKGTLFFNQWIYLKIYEGLYRALSDIEAPEIRLSIDLDEATARISALELGNYDEIPTGELFIDRLEIDILRVVEKCGRARCVLFLDDAAHAFSAEQQRDFFDFFRQIKTREISPKAAIYPGVTTYSSSFHVGHDAEEIDVWVKPDRSGYLEFMRRVISGRFSGETLDLLYADEAVINFLCYASFGIPRAFLNILQSLFDSAPDGVAFDGLKRRVVQAAVKEHYQNTLKLFRSLKNKVPTYRNFVEHGETVFSNGLDSIKDYNKGKAVEKQSVSIAINVSDMSAELARLFSLFQYAGLCISKGVVSRGEKGRFEIFVLHYSGLASANAMLGRKAVNIDDYVKAFSARDAHEFTRVSPATLTGGNSVASLFELSLPPCSACGTPRANKDARFCTACGAKLTSSSRYQELVNQDISALPLTDSRVTKIKSHSSIRRIKDILLDKEHRELRKVDRVGPFWAERIVRLAEEFVE